MTRVWVVCACLWLAGCSKQNSASPPAADAPAATGIIVMEAAAQRRAGLQIAPAQIVQLTERLQAAASVQPADSRVAQVRAPARGRLLEMAARVGDRVRAGQTLAQFDNIEAGELTAQLGSARAETQRLRVLLVSLTRQVERHRNLLAVGAVSKKDFEQSQAGKEALEESIRAQESAIAGLEARLRRFGAGAIAAPFAGIVTRALAAPGEVVESGAELFTVADISRVWVQADVYEKDIGRLRLGQSATIRVDAYPEEEFAGRVTYIADVLDPNTRAAKVRCEVANPQFRLKLDMFATVQLPTAFSRRTLAVPDGALQRLEGRSVVFVQRGPTRFEAREVRAGRGVNGHVEILSGVREGEPVVIAGAFHLKSIVAAKELGEE